MGGLLVKIVTQKSRGNLYRELIKKSGQRSAFSFQQIPHTGATRPGLAGFRALLANMVA
jgi:hypothetical protein